jgi:HEPN domain-containing protein
MGETYMSHDAERADTPLRWLSHARADLALAQTPLPPGGLYEHLCFHAQQAAEKALKAVLIAYDINFPFTHNIQLLIDLLPASLTLPETISVAAELTPYSVTTRYPGEVEKVTEEERDQAVQTAKTVVDWVELVLKSNQ